MASHEMAVCGMLLKGSEPKNWDARPAAKMVGIYTIMEYDPLLKTLKALCVGRGKVRAELDAHFNDQAPLGKYRVMNKDRTKVLVDWEEIPQEVFGKCKEDDWKKFIDETLGYHPQFNAS